MATKIHHVQALDNVNTIADFVDLIKNWDERGKPFVDQLNAAVEAFNTRIDAIGTLDQIDALKAQAESNLTASVAKVAEAIQQAEKIRAEVEVKITADLDKAATIKMAIDERLATVNV